MGFYAAIKIIHTNSYSSGESAQYIMQGKSLCKIIKSKKIAFYLKIQSTS